MSATHAWKFYRIGGFDQVALETADDLLNLHQLDQKLWVALSCPVKGLELDEKTLALIDTDKDGRIRVPELLAAVRWAASLLKDPADLLKGAPSLPVASINTATPEGELLASSIRQVLKRIGKDASAADATITVADVSDTTKIFSASTLNGDGVIPPSASADPAVQALIKEIISCVGSTPDRTGEPGLTGPRIEQFFKDLADYTNWVEQSAHTHVAVLGEATNEAVAAIKAVRSKVNDYFARCRLAAFDARSIAALNRNADEYLAIASGDLATPSAEISNLPLSRIDAIRPLPLLEGVNPAWADALAALHAKAVTPVLGASVVTLTEAGWNALNAHLAPYETWAAGKAGASVEKLGVARAREILGSNARASIDALLAQDKLLEPEFKAISDVERLARLHRDLRELLHNFINFLDLYSNDRHATFQAGVLYLDSRSTELCIQVTGPSPLAATSKLYLAYCDCKRAGCDPIKIAAAFTQGDSDYLFVGRNGIFYDRKGRDWDATITSIVDNPVSIRQAFWSPYKKVAKFVEDQVAKFAAEKEKAADASLVTGLTTVTTAPKPPAAPAAAPAAAPTASAFDIARFAGIFAAIGLAIGAIGGALASLGKGFMAIDPWYWKIAAVAGALLVISGPSMLIAGLKLRQRTIGPLLDANGWAVNGRVHINIPFGTKLTERAMLPRGSKRCLDDPYADKNARRRRRVIYALLILLLAAWIAAHIDHSRRGHYIWQDAPPPAPAAPAQTVTPTAP
ncbi:hypothetical protein Ga0100231_012650 [Opitutaceae bacterium TAV4]|nr:hypothetical protein Ga0100231_012650 [Opitutaceae bacterium TAV4]RRJ99290.1 hypothetical protein Ga0100230_013930 [Opitutaceae bacterium TAV3]